MIAKIVSIASILSLILFAVSFVKFFPPLEKASKVVINKESPQTAVKTTHKRGAGVGYFSRTNHIAYVNNKDWIILGPWTKDQNQWTAIQTALHTDEVVEVLYAVQSNIILDFLPKDSLFSKLFFFSGEEKAQVWSSKAKKWYSQSLKLQTILLAKDKSGEMFFEFEEKDSWFNFFPLVFIFLIPFLIRMRKKI